MLSVSENKRWFVMIVAIIACLTFVGPVWGGTAWLERAKLLASDGAAEDEFGWVCISGDYAIVGACYGDGNESNSGSAYIFKRDGTSWVQQAKLLASDGAAEDEFGGSVSISGDYALVAASGDDDNGRNSGSAYIFYRNEGGPDNWGQQAKLLASDGAANDLFGEHSICISGDYAIVGAIQDDDNGRNSGSAYIFYRNEGGPDNWGQQAKLLASDGASGDSFGDRGWISGDYAIVGADSDDDNGTYSGSAYIFKRDGESWIEQAKLLASDGAADDHFGGSVSISGDYALVGACGDDDNGEGSGSAYIFKRYGTSWVQQEKLLASDGTGGDIFGESVSISGDKIIVGAAEDDDNGRDSGSAYIFKCDGESWIEQAKLTASDGAAYDEFGYSVSISGDKIIVGAAGDDDNGSGSGSAYVFVICPTADLSGDCYVDFEDFAIFASQWLEGPK